MKIYFFTPEFLDAGDGLVAATPNFSYAEDAIGNVYSMRDPEQKAPAAGFPMRISEYIDWTYPQTRGWPGNQRVRHLGRLMPSSLRSGRLRAKR